MYIVLLDAEQWRKLRRSAPICDQNERSNTGKRDVTDSQMKAAHSETQRRSNQTKRKIKYASNRRKNNKKNTCGFFNYIICVFKTVFMPVVAPPFTVSLGAWPSGAESRDAQSSSRRTGTSPSSPTASESEDPTTKRSFNHTNGYTFTTV